MTINEIPDLKTRTLSLKEEDILDLLLLNDDITKNVLGTEEMSEIGMRVTVHYQDDTSSLGVIAGYKTRKGIIPYTRLIMEITH